MPWSGKQAQAIFLSKKRKVGEQAARRYMHQHGHGKKKYRLKKKA